MALRRHLEGHGTEKKKEERVRRSEGHSFLFILGHPRFSFAFRLLLSPHHHIQWRPLAKLLLAVSGSSNNVSVDESEKKTGTRFFSLLLLPSPNRDVALPLSPLLNEPAAGGPGGALEAPSGLYVAAASRASHGAPSCCLG